YRFRFGVFEIYEHDFNVIKNAMTGLVWTGEQHRTGA
ncbi:MAG: hypothetical protein QOK12_460, partial [Mycobacterium sp.]|nr:hypothetical protein [Mycobacterium sp.]